MHILDVDFLDVLVDLRGAAGAYPLDDVAALENTFTHFAAHYSNHSYFGRPSGHMPFSSIVSRVSIAQM